jgi:hypothetical protein
MSAARQSTTKREDTIAARETVMHASTSTLGELAGRRRVSSDGRNAGRQDVVCAEADHLPTLLQPPSDEFEEVVRTEDALCG